MGERLVGTLAETPGREIYFEYSAAWLSEGFSISPYFLPLTSGLKREESLVFEGLLGVFDDSVPDGWGRLLMDRFFRRQGMAPEAISPLDRLAYIGDHGGGALRYSPAIAGIVAPGGILNLPLVAEQAERIAAGSPEEPLPVLQAIGGSSGGSRPKVFVSYHPRDGRLFPAGTAPGGDFEHWLVKFRTREDPADAGSIEGAYAEMARVAGVAMPATTLFDTPAGRFFAIKRFDRGPGETRIHTHTFGGLAHSDFRHPNRDYREFLAITFDLTKDFAAVEQAFRRAVFNVLAHNRDDHVKNHAFIGGPKGSWRLSPAYDLTHSYGVNGQHNMTVAGSGVPGVKDLLKLATDAGIKPKEAKATIESVSASIQAWPDFAAKASVTEASAKRIASSFVLVT
jgi:serine/threonine-protein kinase HipA